MDSDRLAFTDFETNPLLFGWTEAGKGTDWSVAEHHSGLRSIRVGNGSWMSPAIAVPVGDLCRVTFFSKSDVAAIDPVNHLGRCQTSFFDDENREISGRMFHRVHRSNSWKVNKIYIRAPSLPASEVDHIGLRLRVRFLGEEGQSLFIDDFAIERIAYGRGMINTTSFISRQPVRAPGATASR